MTLSDRTHAVLIETIESSYTHDQLDVLFLRLGLDGDPRVRQSQGRTKLKRVGRAAELLNEEDRLIELVRELLDARTAATSGSFGTNSTSLPERLSAALLLDGYEVIDGSLIATTPAPASLGPEISVLEALLSERGFEVARAHYRQAVDSYVDGRREASNGQLRSFLEGLLTELCRRATNSSPSTPQSAIDKLRNAGLIDGSEDKILKGLVGLSNNRGAHAGMTNEDEALFRLHFTTATARYVLARIPRAPTDGGG